MFILLAFHLAGNAFVCMYFSIFVGMYVCICLPVGVHVLSGFSVEMLLMEVGPFIMGDG